MPLQLRPLVVALAALAPCALGTFVASCGSSSGAAGFQPATGDTKLDAGADADARVDLGTAWPDAGNDAASPDAAAGFDAGDTDGGPIAPSCSGTGAPGDATLSLTAGGMTRTSSVHAPPSYDGLHGLPLVLNFHGFSSNGPEEVLLTRMNDAADAHGFLVAYPEGVATSWNAGKCCGTAWANAVDDIAFVKALIAKVSAEYCVDPHRIYATGMSNGGFLSHRLGCEMADTFAAVAPVAGVLGIDFGACKPSRAMPVLQIHGTQDPLVPYNGGYPVLNVGLSGELNFPSVAATLARWRVIDGCEDASETIYMHGDATCVRWAKCQGGAEVALCTIDGGGHTWPGGLPIPPLGKTSTDLNATESIVSFFAAHPM